LLQLRTTIGQAFSPAPPRRRVRKHRRAPARAAIAPVPLPRERPLEASPSAPPTVVTRVPVFAQTSLTAPPASASVPVPTPRPIAAGSRRERRVASAPTESVAPLAPAPPVDSTPAPAPQASGPSECQLRVSASGILVFHPLPAISGPGTCGADDVVQVDAVVLKDKRKVTFSPPATLRCPMAEAVANWIRDDVAPAAAEMGNVRSLINASSYQCRPRNRVEGAKLSEHGHANALDIRGFVLADGHEVVLTDATARRDVREKLRQSACERFSTVLGPGSDGYHEEHVHLDLMERRGRYRMCQWDVRSPPEAASVPFPPIRTKPVATSTRP
jgi:hypothetical protein